MDTVVSLRDLDFGQILAMIDLLAFLLLANERLLLSISRY